MRILKPLQQVAAQIVRTHKIYPIVTQYGYTIPWGKIKLTPPAHSHTTVLLVSSLNFGLRTRGWL